MLHAQIEMKLRNNFILYLTFMYIHIYDVVHRIENYEMKYPFASTGFGNTIKIYITWLKYLIL